MVLVKKFKEQYFGILRLLIEPYEILAKPCQIRPSPISPSQNPALSCKAQKNRPMQCCQSSETVFLEDTFQNPVDPYKIH